MASPSPIEETPITALRPSSIAKISNGLNKKKSTKSKSSRYYNNFIGAAELAGFSSAQIKSLKRSEDPTEEFLSMWSELWVAIGKGSPTISDLLTILSDLGRTDILQQIDGHIHADVEAYKATNPVDAQHRIDQLSYDEEEMQDICLDKNGRKLYFDVFAAFNEKDEGRIWPIVRMLERVLKIRIFFIPRDMPPGVSNYPAQAYISAKRCRKVLCLITKSFTECPGSSFIVRFVTHLSPDGVKKKLIPMILDQGAEVPMIMNPLNKVHFSGWEVQNMPLHMDWNRLAEALQPPPTSRPQASVVPEPQADRLSRLNHSISLPQGLVRPVVSVPYQRSISAHSVLSSVIEQESVSSASCGAVDVNMRSDRSQTVPKPFSSISIGGTEVRHHGIDQSRTVAEATSSTDNSDVCGMGGNGKSQSMEEPTPSTNSCCGGGENNEVQTPYIVSPRVPSSTIGGVRTVGNDGTDSSHTMSPPIVSKSFDEAEGDGGLNELTVTKPDDFIKPDARDSGLFDSSTEVTHHFSHVSVNERPGVRSDADLCDSNVGELQHREETEREDTWV